MAKIFKGQDFRLTLTGGIDITDGSAKIQYFKPGSKTVTEKTATVSSATTAVCYYDFTSTDNDAVGMWVFWLKLTASDSKIYYGEPFKLGIHTPGN